ncbi:MAG TPA: ABC transporter ATP-binding protein [Thermoanaerobaculia bacterium]|jgi:ABC-2 type transport system ATP-binding protein|nr:ABC transporter ATP-binding protein [Thermoanaerobaculia bacterium]
MPGRALLACHELRYQYPRGGRGIFDLTLTIGRGEVYGLLGANGAGKTTLIHLLLGLLNPTSGEVLFDDKLLSEDGMAARSRTAYIPEISQLYPALSAFQVLSFFDGLMGRSTRPAEYEATLSKLGFPGDATRQPIARYSKGMRQKVVIALGILKGADLFVLDEPTAGLDPTSARDLYRIVADLAAQGKAVLFSSHDVLAFSQAASQVGVLHQGRLILEESAASFRRRDIHLLLREVAGD